MRTFSSLDELAAAEGEDLGTSEWFTVAQDRINAFADATDDHQWIHVDPERAASGPFGATVAHGFLTLSLLPALIHEVYEVQGLRMAVNYGLNKVRFPAPVRSGSDIRAQVKLLTVAAIEGGVQTTAQVTVEVKGGDKPCCVAETVSRYYA